MYESITVTGLLTESEKRTGKKGEYYHNVVTKPSEDEYSMPVRYGFISKSLQGSVGQEVTVTLFVRPFVKKIDGKTVSSCSLGMD